MWRPVIGFEGLYEVSDSGQVRNMRNGHILKNRAFPNRYLGVALGRGNIRLVHRLVAMAFIEGDHGLQVNHKDGDRANNHVANLEWVTCSDNHRHSYKYLSRKKHALTRKVRLSKGDTVMYFDSGLAAAKALGVVPGSIASAANKGHACRGFEVLYV
jgi:hypothetical protein